jgi:hypothetical protein
MNDTCQMKTKKGRAAFLGKPPVCLLPSFASTDHSLFAIAQQRDSPHDERLPCAFALWYLNLPDAARSSPYRAAERRQPTRRRKKGTNE